MNPCDAVFLNHINFLGFTKFLSDFNSPSSEMHEFPRFGEQKKSESIERQALFRNVHEFPGYLTRFLNNSAVALNNTAVALNNSAVTSESPLQNITFQKVHFPVFKNVHMRRFLSLKTKELFKDKKIKTRTTGNAQL